MPGHFNQQSLNQSVELSFLPSPGPCSFLHGWASTATSSDHCPNVLAAAIAAQDIQLEGLAKPYLLIVEC